MAEPSDENNNDCTCADHRRWSLGATSMSVSSVTSAGGATDAKAGASWRQESARGRWFERVILWGAVVCLVVLVVLPIASLLVSSFWGASGPTLEHFSEAVSGRLYFRALQNSLVLGAWTGLFSLLIGLPMAWAGARTNVPLKPLTQLTATP